MPGLSTFDVGECCCGCNVTICVVACPGTSPVSGANVQVKSAGVTIASGATSAGGCVTLDIGVAGDYEVAITATGYLTNDRVHTLACGGTVTIALATSGGVGFRVFGCAVILQGATFTFDGVTKITTANTAGNVSFSFTDAGTFAWSVSKARYVTHSGSATTFYCTDYGGGDIFLDPATGYHCGPNLNCDNSSRSGDAAGETAIPDTLFLTDSVYGATTLAYDSVDGHWRGTHANSFGGACGFPAGTGATLIKYDFDPGGTGGKGSVRIGIYNIAAGTTSFFIGSVTGCTAAGVLDWIGTRTYCASPGVCDGTLQCAMYLFGVTITITE